MMSKHYDLAIIGGGVAGAALAYEMSRYKLSILMLEKENDVAMGASRANTAIIHGGYDPEPGTLMGRFNAPGVKACFDICRRLDVEVKKTGSYVIAFGEEEEKHLEKLYRQGLANGVEGMRIVSGEEVRRAEPNLSPEVTAALHVPESGVINPWEFTLAMAQTAVRNGLDLRLEHCVEGLEPRPREEGGGWHIRCRTPRGEQHFEARFVVNAAGVYADKLHNLAAEPAFTIQPARGEYFLLDRAGGALVNAVIFQCPGRFGKGVLVSPTVHDNILVGPNSERIEAREDTAVTQAGLDEVARSAKRSVPSLNIGLSIRNYAGIRANSDIGDFYIQFAREGFLDVAAIKSPGLTCAPVIAEYARDLLAGAGLALEPKPDFADGRRVLRFKQLTPEERSELVRKNPLYGRVICRCETITEGEIVDAVHREITPVSLDAVKRRVGTGMGRCQGGFCGPRIVDILARELGKSPEDILQDAAGSWLLCGETKQGGTPCAEHREVQTEPAGRPDTRQGKEAVHEN